MKWKNSDADMLAAIKYAEERVSEPPFNLRLRREIPQKRPEVMSLASIPPTKNWGGESWTSLFELTIVSQRPMEDPFNVNEIISINLLMPYYMAEGMWTLVSASNPERLKNSILRNLSKSAASNFTRTDSHLYTRDKTGSAIENVSEELDIYKHHFIAYRFLVEDSHKSIIEKNVNYAKYLGATDAEIVKAKVRAGIPVDLNSITDDVMMELI